MATAHLIYGYLGAGKTTFAAALAEDRDAVLFNLDDLYMRLFCPDGPTGHLDAAAQSRLWAVLNEIWPRIARMGVDVVLDFGFWSRERRDEARHLAEGVGANVTLYWLRCPDDIALARCLARNEQPGGSFVIDTAAFDALRSKFQRLAVDEPAVEVPTA